MAKTEQKPPRKPGQAQSEAESLPLVDPEIASEPAEKPGFDPEEAAKRFQSQMNSIEEADWGTRAQIYLYRTEPIIDRTRGGDKKYIMCYHEPINEDKVLIEHGSGKYKAMLAFRKQGDGKADELAAWYFSILNPKFPPKIPPGEWLDDPRNKKWAWAKQYGAIDPTAPAPAAPSAIGDMVGAFQVFNQIEETASRRAKEAQPATPPAPAAPATDPMLAAMTLAEKLLTIRADNPMVTMMSEQLTAMRAELAAQRARSDMLTDKLSEKAKEADKPADPLLTIKTIFETFKSVRNEAADIMPGNGGRSRLGPWMEFFQPVLPSLMETLKPVAVAIAQQAMAPNPAQQHAAGQPQQPPNSMGRTGVYMPAPPPQPQDFGAFLDLITPRMLHFLRDYDDPAPSFASWLHDGWGETAQRAIDTIVSFGGPPALIAWYRTSKYWPAIAPIEPQFTEFLAAVIAWKPEPDESDAEEPTPPVDATAAPIIDLETDSEQGN
jgi:hypothetical protein